MGFGILFIGYFLTLNFAYPAYTDAISAILMLYGLYKMSGINKNMRLASYGALAFSAFGVIELIVAVSELFGILSLSNSANSVLSAIRYAILLILSVYMLFAIRDIASEIKLYVLEEKCKRAFILTCPIYSISIILETLGMIPFFNAKIMIYISILLVAAMIALQVLTLSVIYTAYMRICMPGEEENESVKKPSRFSFVNEFRKHTEERQREYAEYKINKAKKKSEIKKGNKNGKNKN